MKKFFFSDIIGRFGEWRRSGKLPSGLRLLAFLAAVMILFNTYRFAEARYLISVYGSTLSQADAFYFSSNQLLAPDKNAQFNYMGARKSADSEGRLANAAYLTISNAENDLLFNADGVNLRYTMELEKFQEASTENTAVLGVDYDVVLTLDGVAYTAEGYAADGQKVLLSVSGREGTQTKTDVKLLEGGSRKTDSWKLEIRPKSGGNLVSGQYISFRVSAVSQEGSGYSGRLTSSFVYHISDSEGDAIAQSMMYGSGSGQQTLSISTRDGFQTDQSDYAKYVVVYWDKSRMELNPLCTTVTAMYETMCGLSAGLSSGENYGDKYYSITNTARETAVGTGREAAGDTVRTVSIDETLADAAGVSAGSYELYSVRTGGDTVLTCWKDGSSGSYFRMNADTPTATQVNNVASAEPVFIQKQGEGGIPLYALDYGYLILQMRPRSTFSIPFHPLQGGGSYSDETKVLYKVMRRIGNGEEARYYEYIIRGAGQSVWYEVFDTIQDAYFAARNYNDNRPGRDETKTDFANPNGE